jgi:hypothetical protein
MLGYDGGPPITDEQVRPPEQLLREVLHAVQKEPACSLPQRPTIHFTELPVDTSDGPITRESNLYRREVGRLLAEGHACGRTYIRT